jgi:tRNA-modifying protein YgfZ
MDDQSALLTDRSLIEISGNDRVRFLQGLITNDLEGLAEGQARFAGLLTPQGKILFDFFAVNQGETLLLDCASGIKAGLLQRLAFYKLRADVTIGEVAANWRVAAVWGQDAEERSKAFGQAPFLDPRLPELGYRLILRETHAAPSAANFGLYEKTRIGLSVPEGGKDYTYGEAFPHEACYDLLKGVDFKKGCYVGQEVVSRMQHRGTARTRILAVSARHALPEGGSEILAGGFAIGHLGSVAANRGIALARIDRTKEALMMGQELLAGDVPVTLTVPAWATYSLDATVQGDPA